MGCKSYVNGHNLSNFCTVGGCGGWMCNGDAWGPRHTHFGCENCNRCGIFGADFGMMGTTGWEPGHGYCHCVYQYSGSGQPPLIGKMTVSVTSEGWCNCGCHIEWPAGGGMPGVSSYCNNWAKCCAGGSGQGGSGVVQKCGEKAAAGRCPASCHFLAFYRQRPRVSDVRDKNK